MKKVSVVIWMAALVGGLWFLSRYSFTPGLPAHAPTTWPLQSEIKPAKRLPTLVTFIHPNCTCSLATMAELERILPEISTKAKIVVVFEDVKPIRTFDGVHTFLDPHGREADVFGAKTSGQTLLYDEYGILVFAGGLTPARSHEGDSVGKFAVVDFIQTRARVLASSDVFGCSMKVHSP